MYVVGFVSQWLYVAALTLVIVAPSARAELRDSTMARADDAFRRLARTPAPPSRRASTEGGPGAAKLQRGQPFAVEQPGRRASSPDVSPDVLRRVLGARVDLAPESEPVAELDESWVSLEPPPKRPFRPKYMLDVMSFPTGGSGIKLKVRY